MFFDLCNLTIVSVYNSPFDGGLHLQAEINIPACLLHTTLICTQYNLLDHLAEIDQTLAKHSVLCLSNFPKWCSITNKPYLCKVMCC